MAQLFDARQLEAFERVDAWYNDWATTFRTGMPRQMQI